MRTTAGRTRTCGLAASAALPLLLFTLSACGRPSDGIDTDGAWRAAVDTLGSTITVETLGGSVWRGEARLEETASIGIEEGDEHYLFGDVRGIAADSVHIFVLDWQVPVVRVYDQAGVFVRDIGRRGEGPGEYRDPVAIGIYEEGDCLFVRERMGGLIHVFNTEGDFIETRRVPIGGNYSALTKLMRISEEGDLYLFSTLFFPDPRDPDFVRSRYVMQGLRANGTVSDTLNVPWYDYPTLQLPGAGLQPRINIPYTPNKNWNLTHSGAMVGGVSADYRFEIRHHDGRLIRISRRTGFIPVQPEEARWHENALTERMRLLDPDWIWRGPSIPDRKPAFEAFLPDWSGRIWVLRLGPGIRSAGSGEWRDTWLLDVFEEETGRYLGQVAVPPGIRFTPEPWIRDDRLIAYVTDEAGVPYIRCYRLMLPD